MKGHIHRRGSTWSVMWDEPRGADGKRHQRKKGGFRTKREAEAHLAHVLAAIDKHTYMRPEKTTVGEYLTEQWLPSLTVRPSTRRAYESHVRIYLLPKIGHIPLQQLSRLDLRQMFADLAVSGVHKPLSAATVRRVQATVRVALNTALSDDLIARNVAVGLKLPVPQRPQIAVWTATELRGFLDAAADDPLYPIYHFIAMTGTRRGEAVGLRWCDVDFPSGRVSIRQQIIQHGQVLEIGEPKTRAGTRSVALDVRTVQLLKAVKATQAADRLAWGEAYEDSDLVFARENGTPQRPDHISDHFDRLVSKHGLPRIRLHDLRHTHATLMLSKGISAKAVSERLGHSSISLTLDTYSHVLPALGEDAAVRAAESVFEATS